jgi:acetyl esterase/lipase
MMRWVLLVISVACAGLGLLTVVRLPDPVDWRFSILVGQFGYLLAAVPLAIGLLSWRMAGGRGPLSIAVCTISAAAVVLLLQPCAQAWLIARALPASLESRFGPAQVTGQPFTFSGLFRGWPPAAPKTTVVYSGSLKLDFYPAIGRRPAPCVIVIHGGGWDDGDRGQISQFNDWLARAGYSVADISYRLAPGAIWPAQRDDVAAAVAYVKQHAGELGADPERLVIFGRSAGGQIAEAAGYWLHDPAVRGVIALYAPADMNFAWQWGRPDDALNSPELLRRFLGGTPQTVPAAYDSASAILLVNSKSPPTLLVHGTIDTLVWNRQSVRLAARLSDVGVSNMLLSVPWGTHALEFNLSSPSGQLTTYSVAWFLAAVCR